MFQAPKIQLFGAGARPIEVQLFGEAAPAPSETFTQAMNSPWWTIYRITSLLSAPVMFYHGIKRNNGSIGWGLWWGLMGGLFPIITPIVAVAKQPGFAKPKQLVK